MRLGTQMYNFYQLQQKPMGENCKSHNPPSRVTCLLAELGASGFFNAGNSSNKLLNSIFSFKSFEAHKIQFKGLLSKTCSCKTEARIGLRENEFNFIDVSKLSRHFPSNITFSFETRNTV